MGKHSRLVLCLLLSTIAFPQPAPAAIEPGFTSGPKLTTPWYGRVTEGKRQSDLAFIAGMRPHHAGALTMSQDYLSDPEAKNARLMQLARGIIENQTFEIGMLDQVEHYMSAPVSNPRGDYRQIADRNLAQKQRFYRAPAPGPLDNLAGAKDVSPRDVQFSKAMIIHHQAALDMAHDYLNDPNGGNGYLELMCLDILVDQSQEIALMQSIIAQYPGNPDDVKIDSSMIHGMDGMAHHGHVKHGNASPAGAR